MKHFEEAITDLTQSVKPNSITHCPRPTPTAPPNQREVSKTEVRIRGVDGCASKDARERQEHDIREVKTLLDFLHRQCEIVELNRIGHWNENRDETIVSRVSNPLPRRFILIPVAKVPNYEKKTLRQ